MRQFYRMFEIRDAVRLDSGREAIRHITSGELSWTHYRLLMQVADPDARLWYANEAVSQHWSTRQLERQISVLYYERLLGSRKKAPVRKEDEDFYVDLVFYNYLLRCFVLIDLKVGALTHQDIGQMDSYVRVFDAHRPPGGRQPHDRPHPLLEEERGDRPLLRAERGQAAVRGEVHEGAADRGRAAA